MKKNLLFLVICIGCNASGKAVIEDSEPALDVDDFVEPSDSEPADNEPADNEPADNEPSNNEPADNEPSDNEPSNNEPANDEPSDEPDPPPSDKTWTGERIVDFPTNNYCTETQYESGAEVTNDPAGAEFVQACPDCSEVYQITLSPEVICYNTVTFGSERFVGLLPSGGNITLVFFYRNSGNVDYYEVATLSGSGSTWSYTYQADYEYYYTTYPYTVDGSFVIE